MNFFEFIKYAFCYKCTMFILCLVILIVVALIRAFYNDYIHK